MPRSKCTQKQTLIVCIFALLAAIFSSNSHAENTETLFQNIQTTSYSKDKSPVSDMLPTYILESNELSEEHYTAASSKISALLRDTEQLETSVYISEWLSSEDANTIQNAVRYRWMMITSYDLMFFSQFSAARSMLEQALSSIKTWQPASDGAKNTQANLYHIYGQLLVKQKRVAEALPYFYQAEEWFKNIDANHPSIFTINVILGEAFLHAKEYVKAEKYAKRALEIIPKGRVDAISYLYGILASAIRQQERPEDALATIQEYLDNPVDPRQDYFLYFSLVHIEVLRDLKTFDIALSLAKDTHHLAEKVGNKSYLKDAKRHLGFLEGHFGNMLVAERLLSEAVYSPTGISESTSPQVYLEYVDILEQLGKYQTALKYYRYFHTAHTEERERIDRATIANLEQQQRNLSLEKEALASSTKLALAEADNERAQLKSRLFMWAAIILIWIATIILIMFVQLRKKSRELYYMAKHDQLTGLWNRHAFSLAIESSYHRQLIVTDLDGLKHYNDVHGHQKGDELIQGYAGHIKNILDPEGAQLFRIGGDEFAILIDEVLPSQRIEHCMNLAIQRLQADGFAQADASYGIATRDEREADYDWVFLADQRMYEMKQSKKNMPSIEEK
ncbi:diguanylate cyclase [Marinomonas sp. C2222]|uniref:diguanylate cyclase n=1 Tax=Marinomonas sargassi TaxID=2984494 RepID=A0ABT2YT18_9GAMM|nr:tetratricopeptide repeat-containing diguanylate cyclase [Marinomonas sargassi]MCV2403036.1 diguanylate cyclase [Marinomonas sargassi]